MPTQGAKTGVGGRAPPLGIPGLAGRASPRAWGGEELVLHRQSLHPVFVDGNPGVLSPTRGEIIKPGGGPRAHSPALWRPYLRE